MKGKERRAMQANSCVHLNACKMLEAKVCTSIMLFLCLGSFLMSRCECITSCVRASASKS